MPTAQQAQFAATAPIVFASMKEHSMRMKHFSIAAPLLAAGLLLAGTSALADVSTPGWVYGYGSMLQSDAASKSTCVSQISVNVYDYGSRLANGLYFTTCAFGTLTSLPTKISYELAGNVAKGAILTGPAAVTRQGVLIKGTAWVHVWSGVVNGVNGSWIEARMTSNDAVPALLWATGPVWPAAGSTPVKMGSLIRLPK